MKEASGTLKGASNASSLAPVLEEASVLEEANIDTGRTITDTAGKNDGHENGVSVETVSSNVESDRAEIDFRSSLSQPISGTVFIGSTTPESSAIVPALPVVVLSGEGELGAAGTNQAGQTGASISPLEHRTAVYQHLRGVSSIPPALLLAESSEQQVLRKTTAAAPAEQNQPSSLPSIPRGERSPSGQVPIGPGWSLARVTSQVPGSITEKKEDEGLESPPLHKSSLQQQTGGVKHSGTSKKKAHGFLAKAAMLRSSPYSGPLPAFSDTRPTYSRDAQDDETPSYEDSSGNSFVLQLRTPVKFSAVKSAGPKSSQLACTTAALPDVERSACIEREAAAMLRTLIDDDGDGAEECNQSDMGSLTGWQALADQVLAEMEEEEAEEEDELHAPTEARESPTGLMNAAGLLSAPNFAIGSSESSSGNNGMYKPSTELQPGGTFFVQYEIREELGEGAFGTVVKVRRRRDGRMFVAKIMHDRGMTDKARAEAQNEVAVLSSLDHPNVVKYYECFAERGTQVKIVMELCQDGDLDGFLRAQGGKHLSEEEIMNKFVQICLSIHYVHNKGLIHRDLKTCNLLLDGGIIKLGDFGISKVMSAEQNAAQTMVGTPYYMSPEILKGKGYGPKTDVWALGCILYEMCCLRKAFEAPNLGAITIRIMSGKYAPIPGQYSNDMRLLVDALLKKDPSARPCMDDVMGLVYVRTYLKAYAAHSCLTTARRRSSHTRSLDPYQLWADETPSCFGSMAEGDKSSLQNGGHTAERTASQLQTLGKQASPRPGLSGGSEEIFEELKRHLSRPQSDMRSTLSQAEKENEDVEYRAKCKAVNAARHQAQLAACISEKSLAYEKLRMLKQNWNEHMVRPPGGEVGILELISMVPDMFAGIRSRMTPNPAQQHSITLEAVPSSIPSRGRKRRSSSFDVVAAKQNIAHRKSSSFDNGGLGLQQSKPESFLGSYSRLGHGLSGGDSGMAGAGAREVQDDENWAAGIGP
ncbi:g8184 [Coccomyxa elongata]